MPKLLYKEENDNKIYDAFLETEASCGKYANLVTREHKYREAAEKLRVSWFTVRKVVLEKEKNKRNKEG